MELWMPAWGVGGTDDDVDLFEGGDMRVLMLESLSQRAWRSANGLYGSRPSLTSSSLER